MTEAKIVRLCFDDSGNRLPDDDEVDRNDVLLVMAPSSQELEPPANPGRFRPSGTQVYPSCRVCIVVCPPLFMVGVLLSR